MNCSTGSYDLPMHGPPRAGDGTIHRRRGRDELTLPSARRLAVLALAFAAACTRADSPTAARTGDPSGAVPVVAAADLVAIDLLVVLHAISVAREWGRATELAPALKARVAPYEGRVQLDLAIEDVDNSLTPEGVQTRIPPDARFGAALTGALRATITVAGGEVGLVRGDVYAAEGTLATVDGRAYRQTGGRWLPASTAQR